MEVIPATVIRRRISEIDGSLQTLERLRTERLLLESLLRLAVTTAEFGGEKPGPSDALVSYVRQNPGRTIPEVIADVIASGVRTGARNVPKLLGTTVANLIAATRLIETRGRLFAPESMPTSCPGLESLETEEVTA